MRGLERGVTGEFHVETIEGHLQRCFRGCRGCCHVEAIEQRFGGGFALRGCREVYTGMSWGHMASRYSREAITLTVISLRAEEKPAANLLISLKTHKTYSSDSTVP